MPKEKAIWYWIPRVIGLVAILSLLAGATIRINDAERKTKQIPGVKWDLALLKQLLRAYNPQAYDSVMNSQVQIYGPRPGEE